VGVCWDHYRDKKVVGVVPFFHCASFNEVYPFMELVELYAL
jgi:hypothetical protein